MYTGLYVDDIRDPSDTYGNVTDTHWLVARSFHAAVHLLEMYKFQIVSLDHDLGCFYGNKEMTGYDVLMWMVDKKLNSNELDHIEKVKVHSANPVGREKMEDTIKTYW